MSKRPDYRLQGWLFLIGCAALAFILYRSLSSSPPAAAPSAAGRAAQAAVGNDVSQSASGTLSSAPAAEQTDTEPPSSKNKGEPGSCHMGECTWGRTLSQDVVRSSAAGDLIRLSLIGGTSTDSGGSSITWDRNPHDVYVFCSTIVPAVMLENDGALQTDTLDFINGIPRVQETSAAIYQRTCHPGDQRLVTDAGKLGYRSLPEELQEIELKQPTDIFNTASNAESSNEAQ